MIQSIAAAAKIMVLLLVAVFPGENRQSVAFVGPNDLPGCIAQSKVLSDEWKMEQPEILAIMPKCIELDDPVELLNEFLKTHPQSEPQPQSQPLVKENNA